jgi:hypothetical protein
MAHYVRCIAFGAALGVLAGAALLLISIELLDGRTETSWLTS